MEQDNLEIYTWSKLSNWLKCRAYYKWRQIYNLVPIEEGGTAKARGTVLHEGLAEWYRACDKELAIARVRDTAKAMGLKESIEEDPYASISRLCNVMESYISTYEAQDNFEMVYIETPFALLVDSIDPPFLYCGTLDAVYRKSDGTLHILEHKTTSRLDKGLLALYTLSGQVTGYCWALQELLDEQVYGCTMNIMHILKGETKFLRQPTQRKQWQIDDFKTDLVQIVQEIRRGKERNEYFKNTTQCGSFGGCDYIALCKANAEHVNNFIDSEYRIEQPRDLLAFGSTPGDNGNERIIHGSR